MLCIRIHGDVRVNGKTIGWLTLLGNLTLNQHRSWKCAQWIAMCLKIKTLKNARGSGASVWPPVPNVKYQVCHSPLLIFILQIRCQLESFLVLLPCLIHLPHKCMVSLLNRLAPSISHCLIDRPGGMLHILVSHHQMSMLPCTCSRKIIGSRISSLFVSSTSDKSWRRYVCRIL